MALLSIIMNQLYKEEKRNQSYYFFFNEFHKYVFINLDQERLKL